MYLVKPDRFIRQNDFELITHFNESSSKIRFINKTNASELLRRLQKVYSRDQTYDSNDMRLITHVVIFSRTKNEDDYDFSF